MALMEETRRAGRKRCEETRHAILKAAFELLEEGGMGKLTIEGVAARSGSAKTTIYRWWPTKGKLAAEAFILFTQTAAVPPVTGSAVEDLKEHMRLLAAIFRSTTGRIIAGLIAEGHTDPGTIEVYREGIVERRTNVSRRIIERGIRDGEFRADLDIEAALDAIYSPFYTRILMAMGPLDDAYIERLADTVLRGMRA